jgi:hypothetical protein
MDRLANILRGYLGKRYRIRAAEMTAQEIEWALRERGFPAKESQAFGQLLGCADERRYAPAEISSTFCFDLFRQAVDLLKRVRVQAHYTTVPADLAVEGNKSWFRLLEWVRAGGAAAHLLTAREGSGDGVR